MKIFLNNWNQFLFREQKEQNNIKIFCDMDGVLVNFADPILKRMNDVLNSPNIQDKEELSLIHNIKNLIGDRKIVLEDILEDGPTILNDFLFKVIENDKNFWVNLNWLADGKKLWYFLKQFEPNLYILSSPARRKGRLISIEGKKEWIGKNLRFDPNNCFFASEKANFASPNAILIDDMKKNIEKWEQKGGIGILHTSALDTISKISDILSK